MTEAGTVHLLVGPEDWLNVRRDQVRGQAEDWVLLRQEQREPGQVYQELRSFSFFGGARTIWIERIDAGNADEWQEIFEALQGVAPGAAVYLTCLADKGKERVAELEALGGVKVEQPSGDGGRELLSDSRVKLSRDLRSVLEEAYAGQSMRLRNELEKLALYAGGGEVGLEAWREISAAPGAVDGFQFARCVMQRDLARADNVIRTWRQDGGDTYTAGRDLLGAMGYVLRQNLIYRVLTVLGSSPGDAARKTPGRFGKGEQAAAARWNLLQLGFALDTLVDLDRNLKSTRIPVDTQLFNWCNTAMSKN